MRRRRSGNGLLVRMIVIGVIVTIALLPILAYLGAFKAGKSGLMEMTMTTPPPPKVPKQERAAKKPQHQKPHVTARKVGAKTPQSTKALPFHVAASTSKGPPSDNTVVNNTNGAAPGVLQQTPPAPAVAPPPAVTPPPTVAPPPVVTKPAPVIPPPVVKPPAPAPAPHVPVIEAAVPLAQPQPQVPDDVVLDADATFGALLTIHTDGNVDVKMERSTGNDALDKVAMNAARKWRFRPATRDGVPAQSYLHIDIDFQVS